MTPREILDRLSEYPWIPEDMFTAEELEGLPMEEIPLALARSLVEKE